MSLRDDLNEAAGLAAQEARMFRSAHYPDIAIGWDEIAERLRAHATADYEGRLARAVELINQVFDDSGLTITLVWVDDARAFLRAEAERTREIT